MRTISLSLLLFLIHACAHGMCNCNGVSGRYARLHRPSNYARPYRPIVCPSVYSTDQRTEPPTTRHHQQFMFVCVCVCIFDVETVRFHYGFLFAACVPRNRLLRFVFCLHLRRLVRSFGVCACVRWVVGNGWMFECSVCVSVVCAHVVEGFFDGRVSLKIHKTHSYRMHKARAST